MEKKRTQFALYNMTGSLIYSLLLLVTRFIIRRLFLKTFGIEILGYNSTYHSVLNMLNLAELGIGTAILYNLYSPIANDDFEKISGLLAIYKKLYRFVGAFILIASCLITPLLPLLVKEDYSKLSFLTVIFLLQALSTVASYWCAYKRIIVNAYQKAYMAYIVDAIALLVISGLQIADIVILKNYYIYLILGVTQVLLSNLIISAWCSKNYSKIDYRKNYKDNIVTVKSIKADIGNVLMSKLGGYVLNSTDALVVSTILGAVQTGYMTNYTTVFTSFQSIALTMLTTLQPSLGNKIACGDSKEHIESTVRRLTLFSHLIGCLFSVTAFFLIDDFITIWIGNEYVLKTSIAAFFALNVYIFLLMYPISLLFGALGYFKYDKIVVFTAAVLNLVVSILLVFKFGILGVLIGTTLALLIYWISRTIILYKKYYLFSAEKYCVFVLKCISASIICIILILALEYYVFSIRTLLMFVIKAVMYIILSLSVNVLVFWKTDEFHYLYTSLFTNVRKFFRK